MRLSNIDKCVAVCEADFEPSKYSRALTRIVSEKQLENIETYPTPNIHGDVPTFLPEVQKGKTPQPLGYMMTSAKEIEKRQKWLATHKP